VIVDDAPRVVYRTETDTAYVNGLWTGRVEALTVAAAGALAYQSVMKALDEDDAEDEPLEPLEPGAGELRISYAQELTDTRSLMRTMEADHAAADELVNAIERPVDGVYTGESAEDDAGDQAVRTTLTFERDGRITGHGHDEADGAYTIREGRWSKNRIAWIEKYAAQGFEVALRGQVRPDGTIVALWGSSRGIGGTVSLEAPAK